VPAADRSAEHDQVEEQRGREGHGTTSAIWRVSQATAASTTTVPSTSAATIGPDPLAVASTSTLTSAASTAGARWPRASRAEAGSRSGGTTSTKKAR
jgi:hypothetical protein